MDNPLEIKTLKDAIHVEKENHTIVDYFYLMNMRFISIHFLLTVFKNGIITVKLKKHW